MGGLDHRAATVVHQRPRIRSGSPNAGVMGPSSVGEIDSDSLRQRHSCGGHSTRGIPYLGPPVRGSGASGTVVRAVVHSSEGHSCTRGLQRGGRRAVSTQTSTVGMVTVPRNVSEDRGSMGASRGGSLRHPGKREGSDLRVAPSDQRSPGRSLPVVGQMDSTVRISAHSMHPGPSSQDSCNEARPIPDIGVPDVASSAVVLVSQNPVGVAESGTDGSSSGAPGLVAIGQERAGISSPARLPEIARSSVIRDSLAEQNWSAESRNVLLQHPRSQSQAVYDRYWREFTSFLSSRHLSVQETTTPIIADFLRGLASNRQLALSTIKGYVSALRLPLILTLKTDIMKGPIFEAFMKGLSSSFPVIRPKRVQWNLEVVLDYLLSLEPMGKLEPIQLFRKTLFLVAMSSARRVSELAHLGWHHELIITMEEATITYLPEFIAKNETPQRLHQPIRIEPLNVGKNDPDRKICPVRALLFWRQHLRKMTNTSNQLFQNVDGSFQSSRSISNHLVETIRLAHDNLPDTRMGLLRIQAHDVRRVGATLKWQRSHDWATLASSFSWKNPKVFINHYHQALLEVKRRAFQN